MKSQQAKIIVQEIKKRKVKVTVLRENNDFIIAQKGGKHTFIKDTMTELCSTTTFTLANNMHAALVRLKKHGIPVCPYKKVVNIKQALPFLRKHGKIVAKAVRLLVKNDGVGVLSDLSTQKQLASAISLIRSFATNKRVPVFLQKQLSGDHCRVLVLDSKKIYVYSSNQKDLIVDKGVFIKAAKAFNLAIVEFECFVTKGSKSLITEVEVAPDLEKYGKENINVIKDFVNLIVNRLLK